MAQVLQERLPHAARDTLVNDLHSALNPTRVAGTVRVRSVGDIQRALWMAERLGMAVSIAGGRHAMGGQQFGEGTLLLDMCGFQSVLTFDAERGLLEVEAGIQWPELIQWLLDAQAGRTHTWGILQKQTGADRLSLGGALSANIHGRGLRIRPIISDIESFSLVAADGEVRQCSRTENSDLFGLAIGGYGLFGVIASVTLRLVPRRKLQRVVEVIDLDALPDAFERRIAAGDLYGDFQYATAEDSEDFLNRGVFSSYRPVDDATPIPPAQRQLSEEDWRQLLYLAHVDKPKAFAAYSAHYLATSGQVYWSDTHQLSAYLDDYHAALDLRIGSAHPASEVITEIFVPRRTLVSFMEEAREDFRRHHTNVIYGTIRWIERDDESFLAWAREPWACVIFNLHTEHTPLGVEHSARAFRRLIAMAARRSGSYYLTYHRAATREQVESCYPKFVQFLRLKKKHDPEERFQSEWYRHYREMFADVLG